MKNLRMPVSKDHIGLILSSLEATPFPCLRPLPSFDRTRVDSRTRVAQRHAFDANREQGLLSCEFQKSKKVQSCHFVAHDIDIIKSLRILPILIHYRGCNK